ncbi:ABC transporter ATP-binding protein, partial [Mycoplasmopsis pullorum]
AKVHQNQELVIGFRSEDIKISKEAIKNSFAAKISNIELIGKDQLIACSISDELELIINATNSEEYVLYSTIYISFVESRMHIFDAKTEVRIN